MCENTAFCTWVLARLRDTESLGARYAEDFASRREELPRADSRALHLAGSYPASDGGFVHSYGLGCGLDGVSGLCIYYDRFHRCSFPRLRRVQGCAQRPLNARSTVAFPLGADSNLVDA